MRRQIEKKKRMVLLDRYWDKPRPLEPVRGRDKHGPWSHVWLYSYFRRSCSLMSKYLKIGHKFQDGTYSHSPLGRHSSAAVSTVASQHGAMDILCKSSCNHKNKVGTVLYLMSNLSAEFLASPHLVLTVHFSVLCSYFIEILLFPL